MDTQYLERHFDECRLPVEFLEVDPRRRNRWAPERVTDEYFYVDVVTRRDREQRFRIFANEAATLQLLDKSPATRHLLLQVRARPVNKKVVDTYLLGHDERQLFVLHSESVTSISAALERLKPRAVRIAESRRLKVIRQGDWFFIPASSRFRVLPDMILHRNMAIGGPNAAGWQIRVGHPHVAEEQALVFGTVGRFVDKRWVRLENQLAEVYVRGQIRHEEHATVELRTWHRAVQNTPNGLPAVIGYFD